MKIDNNNVKIVVDGYGLVVLTNEELLLLIERAKEISSLTCNCAYRKEGS